MVLEIKNLSKSFGEKKVIDKISFACSSGIATGLLSRNGAGKTTTIRTVLGIISRDGGEVLLDGKPLPSYYSPVGYLPEERGMYPKKRCQAPFFLDQRQILAIMKETLKGGAY